MKIRLIAAALLCLAGSAQAVTLDWKGTNVTASSPQTFDWRQGSFSVALTFNLASLKGDETTLLSVDAGSSKNLIASIVKSANSGDVVLKLNWSDEEGVWPTGKTYSNLLKEGENLIAIVFDAPQKDDLYIDWYINGTFHDGAKVGSKFTDNVDFANVELNGVTPGVGGTLYTVAGVATKEDIGLLPEPTALALLALGGVRPRRLRLGKMRPAVRMDGRGAFFACGAGQGMLD